MPLPADPWALPLGKPQLPGEEQGGAEGPQILDPPLPQGPAPWFPSSRQDGGGPSSPCKRPGVGSPSSPVCHSWLVSQSRWTTAVLAPPVWSEALRGTGVQWWFHACPVLSRTCSCFKTPANGCDHCGPDPQVPRAPSRSQPRHPRVPGKDDVRVGTQGPALHLPRSLALGASCMNTAGCEALGLGCEPHQLISHLRASSWLWEPPSLRVALLTL